MLGVQATVLGRWAWWERQTGRISRDSGYLALPRRLMLTPPVLL